MAHGKALGQYTVKPNVQYSYITWDVVDKLGNVVCWAHDTFWSAIQYAIMLNLEEKTNG